MVLFFCSCLARLLDLICCMVRLLFMSCSVVVGVIVFARWGFLVFVVELFLIGS